MPATSSTPTGWRRGDYVEQLAWLFFLKAFDETEDQREQEAEFGDEVYRRRLNGEYRWTSWASRTDQPDEVLQFVNGELWPHLCNFGSGDETGEFATDPVGEQFRRIFSSVRNHSRRGASFARVVQQVDRLHFSDRTDVIVLSELYEDLLKRVAADSPGYAGEFYTQRHIIRAMVEVVRSEDRGAHLRPVLRDRRLSGGGRGVRPPHRRHAERRRPGEVEARKLLRGRAQTADVPAGCDES